MLDGITSAATQETSQAAQSSQKLVEDLNTFLNLLVAQLENQDPLDPLDTNEFTSQLVEFASVEQQIYANENLESLLDLQQASLLGAVVSYIGKQVEVSGSNVPLENGSARFTYNLDARSSSTAITITDEAGATVYFTSGENDPGSHEFTWNGEDNFGFPLDDGNYTVNVNALDHEGNAVGTSTTVIGTVTGVSMDGTDAVISLGDTEYPVDQVLSVKEQAGAATTN